jgi:sRNA-binding carbon storage regulator CsrA
MPLVFTRHDLQSIRIGDDVIVTVTIDKGKHDRCKLNISAPRGTRVDREEIVDPVEWSKIADASKAERSIAERRIQELERLLDSLADRCEKQSDLLSRRAEVGTP